MTSLLKNVAPLLFVLSFRIAIAQQFTDLSFTIPGMTIIAVDWVDYDADNDLDMFVNAYRYQGYLFLDSVYLFRNDNGLFGTRVFVKQISSGDQAAWEDYDGDGDADLILTTADSRVTFADETGGIRLYENRGNGSFLYRRLPIGYWIILHSAWADFDGDGDLDYFCVENSSATIWRNEGNNVFTATTGFGQLGLVSFSIGDYNNDGLKDIIMTGTIVGNETKIQRNNGGGSFTPISTNMQFIRNGKIVWSDYNSDGFQDVIVCGNTNGSYTSGGICKIYRNLGATGSFAEIQAGFVGTNDGMANCGDYDNDGDMDVMVTGRKSLDTIITKLYRNEGNDVFTESGIIFPGISLRNFTWGDYDNDGDLDILLTGITESNDARIFRNNNPHPNTRPTPPIFLQSISSGDSVVFTWSLGTDNETPSAGLTYALRVGRSPGATDIVSPLANPTSGQRYLSRYGNELANRRVVVNGLTNGVYRWSVQSVDNCYAGSQFAGEQAVTVLNSGLTTYTEVPAGFPGIAWGTSAWSDYDGDEDLDVLVTGRTLIGSSSQRITRLYRNDSGAFVQVNAGIRDFDYSSAAWADCDNDGDIDLLISGKVSDNANATIIYRNDGNGVFVDIHAPLHGLQWGAVAWGDYDGDGLRDLVVCGQEDYGISGYTRVYRNLGGDSLTESAVLPPTTLGSTVAWGDYDSDGDLDLAIGGGQRMWTRIYRNDGGHTFTDYGVDFTEDKPWKQGGPVLWCDYDMDGDLDLFAERRFFTNTGGTFSVGTVLNTSEVGAHSTAVGDLDNDGDPDILIAGVVNGQSHAAIRILRNDGNSVFSNAVLPITATLLGTVCVGDYDSDADLDILLSGIVDTGPYTCRIYKRTGTSNARPISPLVLESSIQDGKVSMTWGQGSDPETPSGSLSYTLKIGSSPASQNIRSTNANLITGTRFIPEFGNMQNKLTSSFETLVSGTYYWAVQSVDHGYSGSAFSPIQSFHLEALPRFSVDTLDFGKVQIGENKELKLTIANEGNIPLVVRSMSISDSSFAVAPSADTIAIMDSASFSILYTPRSEVSHSAHLLVQHNGLAGSTSIPIVAAVRLVPKMFALSQNHPNPFNLGTRFIVSVPLESRVTLKIFDMLGREVCTLLDGVLVVGHHSIEWSALGVASGVYLYRLQAGAFKETRKLILLR